MFSSEQIKLFRIIDSAASASGAPVYVVGGTVRDLFLGADPADKDVDFMIEGDAIDFASGCATALQGTLKKFPAFLTAKVLAPAAVPSIDEVDFASSRTETYARAGKLPSVTAAPVREDLRRRDFTINAMAVPLAGLLDWGINSYGDADKLWSMTVDFFGGRQDIDSRTVRVLHEGSFMDDPTRLFRACRYAARIGGELDPSTEKRAQEALLAGALFTVSAQRRVNEMKKIAAEPRGAAAFEWLSRLGVLAALEISDNAAFSRALPGLKKLDEYGGALTGELKYEAALRVLYASASEPERAARFSAYGVGERDLKRFEKEQTFGDNLKNHSEAALWAAKVTGDASGNAARAEAELARRSRT